MCDPVTAGMVALQGIQTMSGISNQNAASAENEAQANAARNDENKSTGEAYIEKHRALMQGGFDAVLKGRQGEAMAYTSAIENGVQGISVKALMRDRKQKAIRSDNRTALESESLTRQTGASFDHIGAKAQGRINSVAPTSFTIGDAAGILAPIVKSQMD